MAHTMQLDLFPTIYRTTVLGPGKFLVECKAPKPLDEEVTTAEAGKFLGLAPATVRDICNQTSELEWTRKTHRRKSVILITKASLVAYRKKIRTPR
jgi:hypothetical protein